MALNARLTHDAGLNQIVPLAPGELVKPADQLVPADLASSRERCKSMRGKAKNNFQPRSCWVLDC